MNRGKAGEGFARRLLEGEGYRVREMNWSCRYGEVDVIAQKDGTICFVEVKTRRKDPLVRGELSVNAAKQRRILRTALLYLQEEACDLQPRFDVLAVEMDDRGDVTGYNYIMGAFDGTAYGNW